MDRVGRGVHGPGSVFSGHPYYYLLDLLVSCCSTREFRVISRSGRLSTSRRSSVRSLLLSRCRYLSSSLLFLISRSLCTSVSRSSSILLLLNSRSLFTSTSSVLLLLVSRLCFNSGSPVALMLFGSVSSPFPLSVTFSASSVSRHHATFLIKIYNLPKVSQKLQLQSNKRL